MLESLSEGLERITKAEAGERFGYDKQRYTIKEPCDVKDNGHWFCVIHKQVFHNNFEKDGHISIHNGDVRHRLVWWCHLHGPEQP